MKHRSLRAGDAVRVRSPDEILATLDADGTLDGVPFMPEMVDACGRTYHVMRHVEKTCVDGYPMRCFPGNDVAILDSSRCDGGGHDGCKHGCRVFWKHAWLEPVEAGAAAVLRRAPETTVLVRGDYRVAYGEVVAAMTLLQRAGAGKVGFITQPPEQKRNR